jgi:peptide/nickel transport system permease protein
MSAHTNVGGVALSRAGRTARAVPVSVWICAAILAFLLIATVAPAVFATQDPDATEQLAALQAPSADHWFGTDQLGRDVYSRVVYGARYSIGMGLEAVALATVLGTLIGLVAGLAGGVVDTVLMRLNDVLLAFPALLLALVVIAVVGPGTTNAAIAIGLSMTPSFARLVRSEALVVRRAEYVEAAVSLGLPPRRLLSRHVVPNTLAPLMVLVTIGIGSAIVWGSGLSFIGLGTAPPTPEWGAMLAEGRSLLSLAWWVAVFPGVAISASAISVTVVGRHLRRRREGRVSGR